MSVHQGLKDSMARTMRAVAKHEEKMTEKAAKRSAETPASSREPTKYAKKIISTHERRKQKQKELQAEEEPRVPAQKVTCQDGGEMLMSKALYLIKNYLQGRDGHSEATADEICKSVNINITDKANAKLQENLLDNLRIEPIQKSGMALRLRYRPPYQIRNEAALGHVFQKLAEGVEEGGVVTYGIRRSELKESYESVDHDVDEMLKAGRCASLMRSDIKPAEEVLFGRPAIGPVSSTLRNMWHELKVPPGDDLQSTLLARKLRTADEINVRKQRKALKEQQRRQLEKQPKAKRNVQLRKVTNAHMDRSQLTNPPTTT
mmetsp:Transcript_69275/g.115142  ORF Transcript_69275/g.115142 Transcript_69275/m.115142 type:complete len:318 (+) Transcript_69275:69-1022(+)|eukprot:CAMPEP_0119304566 /NCGR_PEP_ID=MMETSP1333-20130426/5762_1 /TAXON_ID=418940 /ORGANISM="Scyphosphaera apsteinii, Strain RCC1455" /LENGTH=317 /DNA_ID=CAMNT_0007307473 /DNA_START=66 /DNA_END=1019 /DNA_ORIENTATION=-